MKIMKRAIIASLMTVFLVGCAAQPIFNVDNHPMPSTVQALSTERIGDLIIEAGQLRGWKFERAQPGHLVASQIDRKYSAVVDIFFDQKSYRISYKSSTGFDAKGDMIHPHYNLWLRNLNKDIEVRLSNAA
jgi:hypothetical protein